MRKSGLTTHPLIGPVCLLLLVACSTDQSPLTAAGRNSSPQKEVLYLTHSAGFEHPVLPLSEEVLVRLGRESGLDVTPTKDCGVINRERLSSLAAIIFYTTGELPFDEDQKAAFLEFIRSGGGFVGIHSATDTFYSWPEYGELIGAYFDLHPWHQAVGIIVEDRSHPSTAHLSEHFEISDEIYQFRNFSRDRVRVLMRLDTTSVDLEHPSVRRTDGDFALAWHREYGEGRVFYTALGHRPEVWRDERFQRHLMGGILWAMRASD